MFSKEGTADSQNIQGPKKTSDILQKVPRPIQGNLKGFFTK